jgi:hypothetical protein
MVTCEQQTFLAFEDLSPCSAPECPASQPVLPGSAEANVITAGSGRQCSMLLDVSNPLGVFSKILLESSHWTNSQEYCYVWNRLDTRFGLSAFRLTPLGQSTDENESLLWRTPNQSDASGGPMDGEQRLAQGHQLNLAEQAISPKLWPTPQAHDQHPGNAARVGRFGTKHGGRNLTDEVMMPKLWPTPRKEGFDAQGKGHGDFQYEVKNRLWPTTQDGSNNCGPSQLRRDSLSLNAMIGGSLNPRFVEELMGFPIDHTALKA